jgi:hypothetical protein
MLIIPPKLFPIEMLSSLFISFIEVSSGFHQGSMEIVHLYVPTRLAQNPSLSYFLSTCCQFSCTRRPFGGFYLLSKCRPTSTSNIAPPMWQSGFLNWNLMLIIVQLHQWEGTTRNLAFLLCLVVVVLEEGEA